MASSSSHPTNNERQFSVDLNKDPLDSHESGRDEEQIIFALNAEPSQEVPYALLDLNVDILHEEDLDDEEMPENEYDEELVMLEEDSDEEVPYSENINLSEAAQSGVKRKTIISNDQRRAILNALLEKSVNRKLKRNTTKEVASLFSVSLRTVQRIWKRAKDSPIDINVDVSSRKPGNVGSKRIEINLSQMENIPFNRRTTLRSLSEALNISRSTLHRLSKQGLIRRHSNAIKPYLKDENKRARLQFCLSMLDQNSLPHQPKFVGMYNIVHIDEKWFYMSKKSENYYILPTEEGPLRTCQSKNFIGKVMFLVAMARPRFDDQGNETFSGKIGVFPFITKHPAQRRSRNREAGTLETKPITSVKKETVRAYLLEKVIPAIQAKWPREDSGKTTIFIQQDNARTHVDPSDEEFRTAASQDGFDIRLMCQPANSPDLNILDLGFFSSLQSLQHKECPNTVDELIYAVEKSFDEYPVIKVNHIFLTLQLCMVEIMKVRGCNRYKIPHLNKATLEREGRLLKEISCDSTLIQNVRNMLAS